MLNHQNATLPQSSFRGGTARPEFISGTKQPLRYALAALLCKRRGCFFARTSLIAMTSFLLYAVSFLYLILFGPTSPRRFLRFSS